MFEDDDGYGTEGEGTTGGNMMMDLVVTPHHLLSVWSLILLTKLMISTTSTERNKVSALE